MFQYNPLYKIKRSDLNHCITIDLLHAFNKNTTNSKLNHRIYQQELSLKISMSRELLCNGFLPKNPNEP